MEKVNGRRGFLKGFGLGGVVVSGIATGYLASKVVADRSVLPAPVQEDISHLAPKDGVSSLQLMADNRPPPPPQPTSWSQFNIPDNGYTISCTTTHNSTLSYTPSCPPDQLNTVSMAVGKDDRLWIKVGDMWKRVVVEG